MRLKRPMGSVTSTERMAHSSPGWCQTPPGNTRAARKPAACTAAVTSGVGTPKGSRAVGLANGSNPIPIIVPCHRVWRSDGGLGGYLFGTDVKSRLLSLERTTPVYEGCTSTHIVCRVGCIHGRHMRADNRVVFASVEDARSIGYRPCKVCKPQAA